MHPTLVSGTGEGGKFVAAATEALTTAVGFRPFPGTLNLEHAQVEEFPTQTLEEVGDEYCDGVELRDCRVAGVRAAVIRPFVPDYPPQKTEVIAPVSLRTLFDLTENDRVPLRPPSDRWPPAELEAVAADLYDRHRC